MAKYIRGGRRSEWMNEKQVRAFIKRIAPDLNFKVEFFTDTGEHAYGALVNVKRSGKMLLKMNTDLTVNPRPLLMHELGHVFGEDPHNRSSARRELTAQRWAIKRSRELGMTAISRELERQLNEKWFKYKWNSCYRKYVLAAKLAQKETWDERAA